MVAHGAVERKKVAPKGDKQKLVLRVAEDLLSMDSNITVNQLVEHPIHQIPRDETDTGRDRRREHVLRAIESLVAGGRMTVDGGAVNVQ